MPRKGQKIVKRQAQQYNMRLYDTEDQKRWRDMLDSWLENRADTESRSEALARIFIDLMTRYAGDMQTSPDNAILDELADLRRMVERLLKRPVDARRIADVAEEIEETGDPLTDDLIDNMLEDFGR